MDHGDLSTNVGLISKEVASGLSGLEFLKGLRDGAYPTPPFAATTSIWITEAEPAVSCSRRHHQPASTIQSVPCTGVGWRRCSIQL